MANTTIYVGATYKHKKTGGVYTVLCSNAQLESNPDGGQFVVYRSVADSRTWIRPVSEFTDGRFERTFT